ncbi:unnamed protein product [Brassica oleracea]
MSCYRLLLYIQRPQKIVKIFVVVLVKSKENSDLYIEERTQEYIKLCIL